MKILAQNKKAFHDYEIIENFEAGIELKGTEVKSCKSGKVNLRDSFVKIKDGEAFLLNAHISEYEKGNISNHEPTRTRKLLLHKREINRLIGKAQEKGLTIIPLKIYLKKNLVKVEIALAKGKQAHDKRNTIKEKDLKKEISRDFKNKFIIK
ncbi:SsrA-binding protein SmpB [Deferribacterales bacterium Es71-Z0220]|uniref:SsrA-binding protein SmpB n=1 Tax=Deferrivibrio essentukiensis TaxID=2880922 RepID=UPI001F60822C|nr:SsrA-binding protein SmpB [Deferrivibrio essentukiensis]MCB4205536.1 SsrA-binding protein SmpB [Deferrivibrio essentukiensis]